MESTGGMSVAAKRAAARRAKILSSSEDRINKASGVIDAKKVDKEEEAIKVKRKSETEDEMLKNVSLSQNSVKINKEEDDLEDYLNDMIKKKEGNIYQEQNSIADPFTTTSSAYKGSTLSEENMMNELLREITNNNNNNGRSLNVGGISFSTSSSSAGLPPQMASLMQQLGGAKGIPNMNPNPVNQQQVKQSGFTKFIIDVVMISLGLLLAVYLVYNNTGIEESASSSISSFENDEFVEDNFENIPNENSLTFVKLPVWALVLLSRLLFTLVNGTYKFDRNASLMTSTISIISHIFSGFKDMQLFLFSLVLIMSCESNLKLLYSIFDLRDFLFLSLGLVTISVLFLLYRKYSSSRRFLQLVTHTAFLFLREQPRIRNREVLQAPGSIQSSNSVPVTKKEAEDTSSLGGGRAKKDSEVREAVEIILASNKLKRDDNESKAIVNVWSRVTVELVKMGVKSMVIDGEQYWWAKESVESIGRIRKKTN